MKTISDYTIYCTAEQTEKALKLGAPIDEFCGVFPTTSIDCIIYDIPTTEQMIGWLEEQGIHEVRVNQNSNAQWYYCVRGGIANGFHSRKEATLAAIDAALDSLRSS